MLGLTGFGVNVVTLEPGAQSALLHHHREEDEFVFVIEGEIMLETEEAGWQLLKEGQGAGFPRGKADGHHLVNKSDKPAKFLEVLYCLPQSSPLSPSLFSSSFSSSPFSSFLLWLIPRMISSDR